MKVRITYSTIQKLTMRIALAAFVLLAFLGCNRTGNGTAPDVGTSNMSSTDKKSNGISDGGLSGGSLTESNFVEWIRSGLAENADLSSKISEAMMASGTDAKSGEAASLTVMPLTETSDQNRLKYWKDYIEKDRLLDLTALSSIMLVDVRVNNTGDPSGKQGQEDGNFSTLLFLKVKSKSDWIFWVRQLHEGMSIKFDTSVGRSAFDRLAENGLNDKEDLTDKIRQAYSFEKKKESDPGLISYKVVSVRQITDETRLGAFGGLLDGDSYLIPSRVEAVKIFEIEVDERFEPARPADGHGDVPHDGTNSFLLMYFKSKVSDSWIEGGAYI